MHHIPYNELFNLTQLAAGILLTIYIVYSIIQKQKYDIILSAALLSLIITTTFLVGINKVSGESMMPNFNDKEYILTDKLTTENLNRYDVIIFKAGRLHESLIKRIYGLPGEKVEIKYGDVYINDIKLNDNTQIVKSSDNFGPFIVPDECCFVLGDNRVNSMDSRNERVGVVGINDVISKVVYEFKTK